VPSLALIVLIVFSLLSTSFSSCLQTRFAAQIV
jgi:hypothetical protein